MNTKQLYLTIVISITSQTGLAAEANVEKEGAGLYKTHCSACHGNTGGMDMNKRLAPPIIAVRMLYIVHYPD